MRSFEVGFHMAKSPICKLFPEIFLELLPESCKTAIYDKAMLQNTSVRTLEMIRKVHSCRIQACPCLKTEGPDPLRKLTYLPACLLNVYLSVCLCPSVGETAGPSIRPSVCRSVSWPVYTPVRLCDSLPMRLTVCLSTHLHLCKSVHLSTSLSSNASVRLSIRNV